MPPPTEIRTPCFVNHDTWVTASTRVLYSADHTSAGGHETRTIPKSMMFRRCCRQMCGGSDLASSVHRCPDKCDTIRRLVSVNIGGLQCIYPTIEEVRSRRQVKVKDICPIMPVRYIPIPAFPLTAGSANYTPASNGWQVA